MNLKQNEAQSACAVLPCVLILKQEWLSCLDRSFRCSSWQFQTISIHLRVFYAAPHEKIRKMKLFHTHCLDFKNKHWPPKKNKKIYVTCTQNWEIPVSYQWCHTETRELVKTVLVTLSGKVLFYNRYKINGTFNHKTFNAVHVRLTSSKYKK